MSRGSFIIQCARPRRLRNTFLTPSLFRPDTLYFHTTEFSNPLPEADNVHGVIFQIIGF